MDIEKNILCNHLGKLIFDYIINSKFDFDKVIQGETKQIILQVQEIVSNEATTDFQKVDDIVSLLNKYNIDTGECHDF